VLIRRNVIVTMPLGYNKQAAAAGLARMVIPNSSTSTPRETELSHIILL
jgi:hypothetical protein